MALISSIAFITYDILICGKVDFRHKTRESFLDKEPILGRFLLICRSMIHHQDSAWKRIAVTSNYLEAKFLEHMNQTCFRRQRYL